MSFIHVLTLVSIHKITNILDRGSFILLTASSFIIFSILVYNLFISVIISSLFVSILFVCYFYCCNSTNVTISFRNKTFSYIPYKSTNTVTINEFVIATGGVCLIMGVMFLPYLESGTYSEQMIYISTIPLVFFNVWGIIVQFSDTHNSGLIGNLTLHIYSYFKPDFFIVKNPSFLYYVFINCTCKRFYNYDMNKSQYWFVSSVESQISIKPIHSIDDFLLEIVQPDLREQECIECKQQTFSPISRSHSLFCHCPHINTTDTVRIYEVNLLYCPFSESNSPQAYLDICEDCLSPVIDDIIDSSSWTKSDIVAHKI